MFAFKKSISAALPLVMAVSLPVMAETVKVNPDGTKTVTEVIGYEETVQYVVPGKDAIFARMDRDGDGVLNWKDFRDSVQMDDEYGTFIRMDKNGDKVVDLNEYRKFDNLRNRVLTESDGDNRISVDRQSVSTVNIPNGEPRTETRFVPAKTQNFGSRQAY